MKFEIKQSISRIPEGVEAGRGVYFGSRPTILFSNQGSRLRIGNFTSIGARCFILLGGHHQYRNITTYPFGRKGNEIYTKGDLILGNDVWIGANVTLLDGLEIGNGAVVAAGSVVVKSIPPFSVVGGNPASLIKMRFDTKAIRWLERIKWWDWSDERIGQMRRLLFQPDVWKFIRTCRRLGYTGE